MPDRNPKSKKNEPMLKASQMKNIITAVSIILLHSFSYGQTTEIKTFKIDSIYGYRDLKLESPYSSFKNILGKKEVLNKHEYSCQVVDSSYLTINTFKAKKINIYFFDHKIRDIRLDIKDSMNLKGILEEFKKTYGPDTYSHGAPGHMWFGKTVSLNYTIDSANHWGVISFRSQHMECYVSKILKEAYWNDDEDRDGIHCPRIDPCDK
jgi:hypothetical protein